MKKRVAVGALTLITILLSALPGCRHVAQSEFSAAPEAKTPYQFKVPKDVIANRLRDPFIKAGIQALADSDYVLASSAFNHALKFEPQNPYLHFLNGFTYHLMVYQGDFSKTELAEVGYQMARQFDNKAWWVEYFSGMLALENKRYVTAQAYFIRTLVLDPKNLEAMKGLATTSYYLGDVETAYQTINTAIGIQKNDPDLLRGAALIHAAAGRQTAATNYLETYKNLGVADYKIRRTAIRVNDWTSAYQENGTNLLLAKNDALSIKPAQLPGSRVAVSGSTGEYKQVVVDVIIIRSEERITNRRGVNLLDGLSMTFGATDLKTITDVGHGDIREYQNITGLNPPLSLLSYRNVFARTLSIPTVTYSLNIFNTLQDRHEVIARPSLMALDGTKSNFFSGAELSVGFPGTLQGGNLDKKEVGVSLEVSPKFLDGNRVLLNVTAKRDFFEEERFGSFDQAVQTSKNQVTASAVLEFNQTLVLSGLSEKETENTQDKVPVLGDIPGLKWFFNKEQNVEYNKSVMFMLTPRKIITVNDGTIGSSGNTSVNSVKIKALLEQWRGYGITEPNIIHIMHTNSDWIKKHVRSGDISYRGWRQKENIEFAVNTAIEYMYD